MKTKLFHRFDYLSKNMIAKWQLYILIEKWLVIVN